METQNGDGYEQKKSERHIQRSFSEKIKETMEGVVRHRNLKWVKRGKTFVGDPDQEEKAKFREKNNNQFANEDVKDALDLGDDVERDHEQQAADEQLIDGPDGLTEFNYLKQKQGTKDSVVINDETVFSDGGKADGSYLDHRNDEPSSDDLKMIEKEEKERKNIEKQERLFYADRGNKGKRGKGRWWRG